MQARIITNLERDGWKVETREDGFRLTSPRGDRYTCRDVVDVRRFFRAGLRRLAR